MTDDDETTSSDTGQRDEIIAKHKVGYWLVEEHRENIKDGCKGDTDTETGDDADD